MMFFVFREGLGIMRRFDVFRDGFFRHEYEIARCAHPEIRIDFYPFPLARIALSYPVTGRIRRLYGFRQDGRQLRPAG